MAHNVEPMDVDCMDSEFDNKENTFHYSNLLPCTEKGYEELDVSELNMKLRYSITPAASPMSKSYTAYTDNKCLDSDDSLNCTVENNLTRSLNSTITKNDSVIKSLKTLPLQSLPTECGDRNSFLKPLDSTVTNTNVTVTINEANEIDDNLSLPSMSSSLTHTPEATTPVNDIKNDNGSPIMRGLKTVLNMFRPSQSPIPTTESENIKPEFSSLDSTITEEKPPVLASTPITAHRSKDGNSSKRSSPLKDSIAFKDDLEKELQWKDETTIFFSQDKIPIHKLFFQDTKSVTENVLDSDTGKPVVNNLNSTVEYMDISYNDTIVNDRTVSEIQGDLATDKNEFHATIESDGEFVDCETTFTNESLTQDVKDTIPEIKDPLLDAVAPEFDITSSTEKPVNELKSFVISSIEPSKDNVNPPQDVVEDTNSTISIIQELDSLLEGNNSKKDVSQKEHQREVIPDAGVPPNTNSELENLQFEETHKQEPNLTMESIHNQSTLPIEEEVVVESQEPEEIPFIHEAKPADVPLPDEDDIVKELKPTEVLETDTVLRTKAPNVVETVQVDITQNISAAVDKIDPTSTLKNVPLPEESVLMTDLKTNNDVLNSVNQTMSENVNESVEKSQIKTPEIESVDINNTITNPMGVLPDLTNKLISNDNEQLELSVRNLEGTQQVNNDIKVIPLSSEPVHVRDELKTLPMDQLNFNPTDPSSDQNNPMLTLCDVNSTITLEHKKDDVMKGINQFDIVQENSSLNIDNANYTVNNEMNVTMENDRNSDVPQHNLTVTNEYQLTKKESIVADDTTQNNVISPVPFDSNSDVKADIIFESKMDTTSENNGDVSAVTDIKKDVEFEETANSAVVVQTKLDDSQGDLPHMDKDTSAVIDIRKDVEYNEMTDPTIAIESKPHNTQEHFIDNVPPADTIASNEIVNKPETSDTSTAPIPDVEIIVSENNSPYVSVIAGIDTEPKATEDNFESIENTFTSTVPSSPPIVSKGYNFNFDEIDNPFATKTKIRLSPPLNTPSKNTELKDLPDTEFEIPKKAPINRRKSQPPERKKTGTNKKKLNTTINAKLPNDKPNSRKEILELTMDIKPVLPNENLNDIDFKPDENLDETTKIELKSSDSKDINVDAEAREDETCQANDQSCKLEEVNKLEQKSSCESSGTNISVKTSSSDQSNYFSAGTSSTESFKSKNVFNLPEIDDVNFNPFATKSKMRQSPPPLDLEENPFETKTKIKVSPESSMILMNDEKENTTNTGNIDVETMEKEVDISNETASPKAVDEINLTHEINTEDEDTEEGPFLEAEDALDKESSGSEFNRLPTQSDDNLEAGEMFIDAETFEFLLNQNKSNMVADSGKESLFLKFDPLFAKKISSDGVVAALSKVQKRHSTPTKIRPSLRNDDSPVAGPSNINITYETNLNASPEDSNEDINITVSKPTMIVTPAVNPAITPRNKSITPNRSNRRSTTFTSPAMAVIDRLLSMSANNSLVDTTVTQSQSEADVALTQLRELLAEKEIDVYNLKAESMELKERLNTMESQMKVLEADGKERLQKINELNSQLVEKSKINKSMAAVVEEYERTIASLIAETEQDKKRNAEERMRLINERDEQTAHLASMEASFSDLHSKYEKSKQVILNFKANEEAYEKSIKEFEVSMTKMQSNYEMLKQHATSKLNHANSELEKINKAHEAEVLKLNALLKRNTLHITSLEETLAQKTKANDELTAICDELINKVG